jgi:hypothetical protein
MDLVRIGLLAIGGWLVAAVLTVGVSWTAISVVRDAVAPASEVAAALPTPDETAGSTAPGPTASATTPRTPRPSASTSQLASASGRGGTASVRCVDGRPDFVNVAPRSGYEARQDDNGAEVEFRSSAGRTEMSATCAGGVPRIAVEDKDEGGSGRGGDDD